MGDHLVVKRGLLWAVVAAIFVLAFLVIRPIVIPIIFGLLFAYIFHPIYRRLNRRLGKGLSAFLLILGIVLIVAGPIVYFTPTIVNQSFQTYLSLQKVDFVEPLTKTFPSLLDESFARALSLNIDNIIGKIFSYFMNQFTNILVNAPHLFLQFAVFLFTFFFALRDSKGLKKYFSDLSPFSVSTEKRFFNEFRGITNAIIFGQVLIGVIQGLAVGIGLLLLGVPNVLILTLLAAIVSIIPILGSWIVWLPVSIFLFISGQLVSGIILILYGVLFVSTLDNFLRPYFLSRASNLPIALSVMGTIGGLYFFGIAGLVLGPLILAYAMIIIEFYRQGKLNELFRKR
jgi:predicted PurR-regulated permease PerM